jgi:anti-sigma factor ChrR (cupin superfamily)
MSPSERGRVVVDTTAARWAAGEAAGHMRLDLYAGADGERVSLERLEAGARLPEVACAGGEEIFVLSGVLADADGRYGPGTWLRRPAGQRCGWWSDEGASWWAKRGHLRAAS